ncbi:MAG TPA: hypothetical protein VK861_04570 [Bacteroidales bacterium]|nr:hypothetical protein [Bacteroidales bacterium]
MPHLLFNRDRLTIKKLAERKNNNSLEQLSLQAAQEPSDIPDEVSEIIKECALRIRIARDEKRSVMLAFGAHTIKNGLAPVLISLMKEGWLSHLATNGAGIIHDWEFAFQGTTGENVRENVDKGEFGIWDETGFFINLAIATGAYLGLGYGESVGKMICDEGLEIPGKDILIRQAGDLAEESPDRAAAALDLMSLVNKYNLKPGFMEITHPFKWFSVQCAAYEMGIPFTGHPMIGHDIIYNHPANNGAAIGRSALRDFLCFTESVSNLDQGVYMSVGSAIMSPMIFEKALSMAQNIMIQSGSHIDNHYILVVDLANSEWDWTKNGEPPPDNPAYYLRYNKTFSRMGGAMRYIKIDTRDFLPALHRELSSG